MTANDDTGATPKSESTDSDQLDASTTRRRLLGGAAALATIPAVTSADADVEDGSDETTVDTDEYGPRRTPTGKLTGLWSSTELGEETDDDAEVSVVGYYHDDDEPNQVEMWVSTRPARTCLNLDVEETRELARRLLDAADAAEGDL